MTARSQWLVVVGCVAMALAAGCRTTPERLAATRSNAIVEIDRVEQRLFRLKVKEDTRYAENRTKADYMEQQALPRLETAIARDPTNAILQANARHLRERAAERRANSSESDRGFIAGIARERQALLEKRERLCKVATTDPLRCEIHGGVLAEDEIPLQAGMAVPPDPDSYFLKRSYQRAYEAARMASFRHAAPARLYSPPLESVRWPTCRACREAQATWIRQNEHLPWR